MPESAPLFATPDAPVPSGAAAEWFTGAGGARLRAALFLPGAAPRGSVVVSPGRTEPIEKYLEVAGVLTARGFATLVHDWRGHGLSKRLTEDGRGDARGWRDFITDYDALLAAFEPRLPKPWIALGHSMGGCLTLLALAQGEQRFSGAALSSPMLGLLTGAVPPWAARLMAGVLTTAGLGSRLASPESPAPEPFEANVLTHDARRYQRNLEQIAAWPQLRVGPPTWGWLDFAFRATELLSRGSETPKISIPLTVVAAGEERLVDNAALQAVTARIPGARFLTIPGAYHELLQETDEIQAVFWREFDDLTARAGVA